VSRGRARGRGLRLARWSFYRAGTPAVQVYFKYFAGSLPAVNDIWIQIPGCYHVGPVVMTP
jgi:hypothetical protein